MLFISLQIPCIELATTSETVTVVTASNEQAQASVALSMKRCRGLELWWKWTLSAVCWEEESGRAVWEVFASG